MWRLDHPQVLLLLLIVPLLIYLLYYRKARGGKISFNFGIWNGDRFAAAATSRRVLLVITRVLILTLLLAVSWEGRGQGVRLIIACGINAAWAALLAFATRASRTS